MKREPKTTSSLPSRDGFHQSWIFARIVFEIGVLDDDDIPGRLPKARPQGCVLPLVDLVMHQMIYPAPLFQLLEHLPRAIARAIVDDYDFFRVVRRIAHCGDD
jgi:hypothetical protein